MKEKIIATSWHPGGVNAISPVIKRLEEEEKVEVTTIGHLYSEKIFDNNDIPYRTISYYGLNDVSVKNFGKILQEEIRH